MRTVCFTTLVLALGVGHAANVAGQAPAARNHAWVGQKVIILPPRVLGESYTGRGVRLSKDNEKLGRDPVNRAKFYDKTGVIKAVDPKLGTATVVLDLTSQEVIAAFDTIGFAAEMDLAKKRVGQVVWARGVKWLVEPSTDFAKRGQDAWKTIPVYPATKLTVRSVKWALAGTGPALLMRDEHGGQGLYLILDPKKAWDPQFHNDKRATWVFEKDFLVKDPAKTYAAWSPGIWSRVKAGSVGMGMDKTMLDMVCDSWRISEEKFKDKEQLFDIGVCYNPGEETKFLFQGGKVIRLEQ